MFKDCGEDGLGNGVPGLKAACGEGNCSEWIFPSFIWKDKLLASFSPRSFDGNHIRQLFSLCCCYRFTLHTVTIHELNVTLLAWGRRKGGLTYKHSPQGRPRFRRRNSVSNMSPSVAMEPGSTVYCCQIDSSHNIRKGSCGRSVHDAPAAEATCQEQPPNKTPRYLASPFSNRIPQPCGAL